MRWALLAHAQRNVRASSGRVIPNTLWITGKTRFFMAIIGGNGSVFTLMRSVEMALRLFHFRSNRAPHGLKASRYDGGL